MKNYRVGFLGQKALLCELVHKGRRLSSSLYGEVNWARVDPRFTNTTLRRSVPTVARKLASRGSSPAAGSAAAPDSSPLPTSSAAAIATLTKESREKDLLGPSILPPPPGNREFENSVYAANDAAARGTRGAL